MSHGSEPGVLTAVATLAVLALAGPLVRTCHRGTTTLARWTVSRVRDLAARSTRRAALGLLGSGAVLATSAAPTGAAAAATAAAPAAAPADAVDAVAPRAATSPRPRQPVPALPTAQVGPQSSSGSYVVLAGDSLWDIARRHLPAGASDAAVADAWPRWWAANRAAIGPDPGLIHPGTRLVVPPRFRSTGTSTPAATAAPSFDPDRR